ncbi:MAG: glycosyltransferase family 39 protein [Phycisphaerae bacterium]|nr:glycosyltransferase family 39 protein [Phycisphaerae bacterium]
MSSRTLPIILLLALAVRVGLLATLWQDGQARIYAPDSEAYIQLSHSLVEQGTFQRDGQVEIFRTPGYPLLLAFSVPWGESWWRAVLVGQVILDVALVYLTCVLGWTLLGERAGLIAAALLAFEPLAAAACLRILSDSVYAFLFTLAVLLWVHHLRSGRMWALAAGALVLAAACYVRPTGLVMAAVTAVVLLLAGGERRWVRAGALVSIVAVACAPWVVHNAVTAGYMGFSSFASDGMYYFAAPEVIAATEGIPPAEAREELKSTDRLASAGKTPGQAAAARRREAVRIIRAHPWLYARIHLLGSLGVFLPAATDVLETAGITRGERGTVDVLHTQGLVAAVRHYFGDNLAVLLLVAPLLIATAVQYLGTVLCLLRRVRWGIPPEGWLLAALVVAGVLLPGPFGLPRYRLAITPLLCVAAAAGLTSRHPPQEEANEEE